MSLIPAFQGFPEVKGSVDIQCCPLMHNLLGIGTPQWGYFRMLSGGWALTTSWPSISGRNWRIFESSLWKGALHQLQKVQIPSESF